MKIVATDKVEYDHGRSKVKTMAMSDFKKKALREMNTRFVWTVLVITVFFMLLNYAVTFVAKLFSENFSEGAISKALANGNLTDAMNGFSFLDLAQIILFVFWALFMLVLFSKWIFRQIIARRK